MVPRGLILAPQLTPNNLSISPAYMKLKIKTRIRYPSILELKPLIGTTNLSLKPKKFGDILIQSGEPVS